MAVQLLCKGTRTSQHVAFQASDTDSIMLWCTHQVVPHEDVERLDNMNLMCLDQAVLLHSTSC